MIQSPETASRIAILRAKIADNTITEEELKEGIRILREGRLAAAQSPASATRKKAIAAIPDANSLLDSL